MNARTFLLSAWEWKPGALALCAVLAVGYAAVFRFKPLRKAALFAAGWVLLFLTLTSPLHALADDYLFSAHMLMHLLLLMVIPLLFVCSLPDFQESKPRRLFTFLTYPLLTWAIGLGAMWVWHQPSIFEAAHENPRIHELQIASLLLAGFLFWMPIAGPLARRRLAPLPGIVYLFTACLGCTILGIGITFAPPGLFAAYTGTEDEFGIQPLIRSWGMTPPVDQQFGGLMMWVPPCLIYVSGVMVLLARLYRGESTVEQGRDAVPTDSQKRV
jgi:putative membrane protein